MRKQILMLKNLGGMFILTLAAVFIAAPAVAYADTQPYVRATGGDAWAGGWFNTSTGCDTSGANYQDPSFPRSGYANFPPSNDYGGFVAYSQTNGNKYAGTGSAGDFGVFALGAIDASSAGEGFASGAVANDSVGYLSFAKPAGGNWGGLFEGSTQQSHCISDYYSKLSTGSASSSLGSLTSSTASGVYTANAPASNQPFTINSSPVTIGAGSDITIYINGPAYIGANITYPSGLNVDNVPKLAIVVKGSLYVGSGVTELDGLYIAQPNDPSSSTEANDNSGTGGEFWTCSNGSTSILPNDFPLTNCTNKLTVNGAVIAKRVNLLRIGSPASSQLTEEFDYTPAMVVNGPFFSQTNSSSIKIESLISLPPVF